MVLLKALPENLREVFERFFAAYPKRRDAQRRRAENAFAGAVQRGADPEVLARAAGRYAALCKEQKREDKHIKLAAGWIEGELWADYPDPAAPVAAPPAPVQDPTGGRLLAAGIPAEAVAAWFGQGRTQLTLDLTDPPAAVLRVTTHSKFAADTISSRFEAALIAAFAVDRVIYRWPGGSHD